MRKKLKILFIAATLAVSSASVALASTGSGRAGAGTTIGKLCLADYDSNGKLVSVSVYDNYKYTTDDAVREYVGGLKKSQKAFIWDNNQKPIARAIYAMPEKYGDNNFSDAWEY